VSQRKITLGGRDREKVKNHWRKAYRDEHGSGLDQDWSQFWPDQDWIGLQIFFNWRIRTGSDWENLWLF